MSVGMSCGHASQGVCRPCEMEGRLRRLELERWNWEQSARHRERERDEARVEVERLRGELAKAQWHHAEYARISCISAARHQREACASMVEDADDGVPLQCLADAIRATPLVTEGDK